MRYAPNMLMIGSTGRNVGKTEFATAVIRKFAPQGPVVGLKVTAVDKADGACPRGGAGCGVCSSLTGPYLITEETHAGPEKDTMRLLDAGATRVYWLRVLRDHLVEGMDAVLAMISAGIPIVCESNSLRTVLEPGLFVMMKRRASAPIKDSAARVLKQVDRLVISRSDAFARALADLDLLDDRWVLREDAAAIILAGGESTRMGRDKSLLPIQGVPMAARLCNVLRPWVRQLLVSTNDPGKHGELDAEFVVDALPGQGPLMGIASALKASHHDLNLVVACDIPNPSMRALRGMLRASDGFDAVVPTTEKGRLEPLFALYRRRLLPGMEAALSAGEGKVRSVFKDALIHYFPLPETDWPRNLNRPEDYEAYMAAHKREEGG